MRRTKDKEEEEGGQSKNALSFPGEAGRLAVRAEQGSRCPRGSPSHLLSPRERVPFQDSK